MEGEKYKKKYYNNNIIKTKKFINFCIKRKIEDFMFLSSSNVYEEKKYSKGFREINNLKPKNFYGQNKLEIEKKERISWADLLNVVNHDELVYKLTLKYLRRDGYDIGNNKKPEIKKQQ